MVREGAEDDTSVPAVDVSVLIPVLDEVDSLEQLTQELTDALDGWETDGDAGLGWEVIYIDDGSSDGSWERIVELGMRDPRIRGVKLRRNFGKSAALTAGLASSTGSVVATMDGDLQDDPRELPGMIALLGDGADLVTGHKAERKDPLGKRLPSKMYNFVTSVVTGLRLRDHNCGLKVGQRAVFENVPLYGEMHRFFASISHARGFDVVERSVHHRPREHGRSKFGLERYARGGLDLLTVVTLTRYSRRPAHLFGGLGLFVGMLGSIALLYLTGVWLFTDESIGGRPLLLFGILFVILAVQLISLGLIAEMLVSRQAESEDPLRHVTRRSNPLEPPEREGRVVQRRGGS